MTAPDRREPLAHVPVVLTATEAAEHVAELSRLQSLADRCVAPVDDRTPAARRDAEEISREHAMTAARIVELESLLRSAQVLSESAPPVVAVGVEVEVHYLTSARNATYRLTAASLPTRGSVSMHSPIGQALMGKGVGELVRVELPGGRSETLRIDGLSVEGRQLPSPSRGATGGAHSAATIRSWQHNASPPL